MSRPLVAEDPTSNFFQEWLHARMPRAVGLSLTASSHPTPEQRAAAVTAHLRQVAHQVVVFEAGLWWYYAGDYARSIRAFEQFLTFFPSREVYHNLAVSHHQLACRPTRPGSQTRPLCPCSSPWPSIR